MGEGEEEEDRVEPGAGWEVNSEVSPSSLAQIQMRRNTFNFKIFVGISNQSIRHILDVREWIRAG